MGELHQPKGEVLELGVHGEEARRADVTSGETTAVTTAAGIAAVTCDAQATVTDPCTLVTPSMYRCTNSTFTCCGERE